MIGHGAAGSSSRTKRWAGIIEHTEVTHLYVPTTLLLRTWGRGGAKWVVKKLQAQNETVHGLCVAQRYHRPPVISQPREAEGFREPREDTKVLMASKQPQIQGGLSVASHCKRLEKSPLHTRSVYVQVANERPTRHVRNLSETQQQQDNFSHRQSARYAGVAAVPSASAVLACLSEKRTNVLSKRHPPQKIHGTFLSLL